MLDINVWEILLYIVNIIILFLVLRFLLFKPISKFLNKRTSDIQIQVDEAAKKHTEAEQLKAKYDEMVGSAKDLAAQLINQGRKVADDQARQIVEDAESTAREIKARTTRQISEQKQQAVFEMRQDITKIAIQIAEKVLEREVSMDDNKQIIDDFFEKVGNVKQ